MPHVSFGERSQAVHELAAVGPIIDVVIRGYAPNAPAVAARGLIDTGASVVCIDRRIALRLGLTPINQMPVAVAGGTMIDSTIYMGRLDVPVLSYSETVPLYSAPMMQAHHDVLLGRSFLRRFIVTFNGPEDMFHFALPQQIGSDPLDDFAT